MNRIHPMLARPFILMLVVLLSAACSETETGVDNGSTESEDSSTNTEGAEETSDSGEIDSLTVSPNPEGQKDSTESDVDELGDTSDVSSQGNENDIGEQDASSSEIDVSDESDSTTSDLPDAENDSGANPTDTGSPSDVISSDTSQVPAEDVVDSDTSDQMVDSGSGAEDVQSEDATQDVEEETIVFSDPVPVSEPFGYGQAYIYSLAVTLDDRVGVLWAGSEEVPFGQTAPPTKLLFSISDEGVTAFEPPLVIAEEIAGVDNQGDILVTADESFLVTWQEVNDPASSINFRKASDSSMEGSDITVATSGFGETLYRPYFIEKNSSEFCIAYQRSSGSSSQVELTCTTDGGLSFEEPRIVTPPNLSGYVSSGIYIDDGTLIVAYHGHEFGTTDSSKIYIQSSSDNGLSFETISVLSSSAPSGLHYSPSLAIGSTAVYGAWHRKSEGIDSWFTSSTNAEDWAAPTTIPGIEEEVKLRAGEGTVLYATSKIADINPILAKAGFVRSGDAGATWGELYPIETVGDAFILDHDIISNRKKNLLHMVWSQFADGQLLDQALYVMTISDEEAQ